MAAILKKATKKTKGEGNPSTSPLKSLFDSSQLSGSINVQDGGTTSFLKTIHGSRSKIRLLCRLQATQMWAETVTKTTVNKEREKCKYNKSDMVSFSICKTIGFEIPTGDISNPPNKRASCITLGKRGGVLSRAIKVSAPNVFGLE